MERRRSIPVGIVVRRTPGATRWSQWCWRAVAALPGAEDADWRELRREGDAVEFHAATGALVLHRADAEAYAENLDSGAPSIWAVMHKTGEADRPFRLHALTASPHEAQLTLETGEELIERIPLTPALAGWIAEFVETHYEPEAFRKRQRAPADPTAFANAKGDARVRQASDVFRTPGELKPRGRSGGGA
ncbi:MAG: DUF3305 domain-containing protein [Rubrimonas sp.]|uniref:DUF3305 domain-containing protein n=1 Tax=Rubrimonas sp. TaxID=2036015 RepID=UPI002FDEB0CA